MNRNVHLLLIAQFLSAFADNALLFTAIALVLHSANLAAWYIPALQASFLVAFVVFAPWVGVVADRHCKVRVLFGANGIKALGAGLLMARCRSACGLCRGRYRRRVLWPGQVSGFCRNCWGAIVWSPRTV